VLSMPMPCGTTRLQTGGGSRPASLSKLADGQILEIYTVRCQPLSKRCARPDALTIHGGTRETTRTSNLLVLSEAPLPLGYTGKLVHPGRVELPPYRLSTCCLCRWATDASGAGGRIRTGPEHALRVLSPASGLRPPLVAPVGIEPDSSTLRGWRPNQ
jgi:hypothetical protein